MDLSELAVELHAIMILEGESGDILGFAQSAKPFPAIETGGIYFSSEFPVAPIRSDRAGFYQIKDVKAAGKNFTAVSVARVGNDEKPGKYFPSFRYRGWELNLRRGENIIPDGFPTRFRRYWIVSGDGQAIGAVLSDETETLEEVASRARELLDARITV